MVVALVPLTGIPLFQHAALPLIKKHKFLLYFFLRKLEPRRLQLFPSLKGLGDRRGRATSLGAPGRANSWLPRYAAGGQTLLSQLLRAHNTEWQRRGEGENRTVWAQDIPPRGKRHCRKKFFETPWKPSEYALLTGLTDRAGSFAVLNYQPQITSKCCIGLVLSKHILKYCKPENAFTQEYCNYTKIL